MSLLIDLRNFGFAKVYVQ